MPRNRHQLPDYQFAPRDELNGPEVGLRNRHVDNPIHEGAAADKQCAVQQVQQGQHTRDSGFHQLESESRTGHAAARFPRNHYLLLYDPINRRLLIKNLDRDSLYTILDEEMNR